ncbi:MAG TPA: SdiA-regulated domain-containing protein [Daejeonella sp.]|nr:SdiA-regulated domain-containing protein [Daejeonella sp.]
MIKFPLILLAILAISCNNPVRNDNNSSENSQADATVEQPKNLKLHELPSALKEISGISFLTDNIVLAIQDEEGILYQYDLAAAKTIKEFEFGKPGDYEDLVRVDKDVYIVSSNGSIVKIKDFQSAKPEITKFKTALTKDNDIEGLCYEPKKNRLLLAAKANGLDEDENTKEIYAFNLTTMKLDITPAYTIRLTEIENYFKGDALEESSKKFLKALGNRNINKVFRSSAITVDPKSDNIFVLSSINNLIAVLTPEGKMSQIIQFEGKEHKQPEGLAFAENGKLYVSNEAGKNGKSNIIELEYAN